MSAPALRSYRFSTPAQWRACLFERIDRPAVEQHGRIQATAPYAPIPQRHPGSGAHAPVFTRAGEVLWLDDRGCVHRLSACDEAPSVQAAPWAADQVARLLAGAHGLWIIGPARTTLERYDAASLARLNVLPLPDARAIDLADDGHDTLFALLEQRPGDAGDGQALRIDGAGRIRATLNFAGLARPAGLVFLRRARRFVALSGGAGPRLHWFTEDGAAVRSVPIGALRPCFSATALGSDGRERVFLAGSDAVELGGTPWVLVFGGDGEPLDQLALAPQDAPLTGVTGARDSLLVTGARGLLRFGIAAKVPDSMAQVRCSLITPVLYSPQRDNARRWLRIEAGASLPDGASLDIAYAASADPELHQRLCAIAGDRAVPPSLRLGRLLGEPGIWRAPISFQGSRAAPPGDVEPSSAPSSETPPGTYAAPLFDVHDPYVWVCITLSATAGAVLPSLSELSVLYGGPTLMDQLPAIYRRVEAQPGSFLRALVGVLESTTQGFDERIGALASHVHPASASGPWLDFVAGWLGLPWDEALAEEQKKRLLARAAELARARGTRAGLEALLECLMPAAPPVFQVIDATADVGFAIVGGAEWRGSALPALLGGRAPWRSELDFSTQLGRMRLPCAGQSDDGGALAGRIRIEVAATAQQRRAWEPWLERLIHEMVPLGARVQLRWLGPDALYGRRIDGALRLEAAPGSHLGSDAVLGLARLPERASRILASGADIGTRLE